MVPADHRDPRCLGCLGAPPWRRRCVAAAPSSLRAAATPTAAWAQGGIPLLPRADFLVVLLEPINCPINVAQRCLREGKAKGAARPTYSPDLAAAETGRSADIPGKDLLEACLRAFHGAAADCGSGLGVVGATPTTSLIPWRIPNHLLPSWTELRTLLGHILQISRVTVNEGQEPRPLTLMSSFL